MTDLARGTQATRGGLDLGVADPRQAIRRAKLHSLFVHHIRLAIILSCAVAIGFVGIIAFFDPFKRLPANVSVGHVGLQGSRVTMTSPKMSGKRPNGQPFEVTGVSGIQDILKPSVVELVGVIAKIGMDDSTISKITAQSGVYDSNKDKIWLKGKVRIINNGGYDIHMPSAIVDIKSSALISNEPVLVFLNGGRVAADHMIIGDNGHKISFDGEVDSVVDSSISVGQGGGKSAQAEAAR